MLLTIAGLFTHSILSVVLLALFGAVFGSAPTTTTAAGTAVTSTPAPTTGTAPSTTTAVTTTPPAPRYVVRSIVSGDSVVVTDGTRTVTVTIAGIDAPDAVGGQCWAAESLAFATSTLLGQEVTFGAAAAFSESANLVLADGRDFVSLAVSAGTARAVDSALLTDAVRAAAGTARTAGLGLWGAPCFGELVAPAQPQPLVPAPTRPKPAPQPQPEPAPEPDPAAGVYFANCAAAKAAGAAPLYAGQPGYRPALDRDKDGVACET